MPVQGGVMLLAGFDAGQTRTRCRISRWHESHWELIGDVMDPAFLTWHQRMGWTVSVKQSAAAVRKR